VWQEAVESGALDPGAGYVVAWKSVDDVRRLVAAGYQVVAAPAPWHYLDHATDESWWSPGASWAGQASRDDVARFDVTAGWSPGERAALLGIQACLWTEHVHDLATLRRLLLPRLSTIADAAWEVH
jgi:hexosaminidase